MTGRELIAAVRPMEAFAASVASFAKVAHEAVRLEEGMALATAGLEATRAALSSELAELERIRGERASLAETLQAERKAAEDAIDAACAAKIETADKIVIEKQRAAESWTAQEREARGRFEANRNQWQADEQALKQRVNDLKDMAKRMGLAAEAVLR